MDRDVTSFNTRLRTIKIRELFVGIILALIITFILGEFFPIIDMNDDLYMIILLTCVLIFFIFCLRGTTGLKNNISNLFVDKTQKEIFYVFIINLLFAYAFLFFIVVLDFLFGMSDPTWTSVIDIDSVDMEASAVLFSIIASLIFAPILEELIFRGVLFNRLKVKTGIIPAMLISSFLFGIGHDFGSMTSAFLFGICMCILYLKTDNILVPMSVHFINNAVAIVLETTYIDYFLTQFPGIILLGLIVMIAAVLLIKYIVDETTILKKTYS